MFRPMQVDPVKRDAFVAKYIKEVRKAVEMFGSGSEKYDTMGPERGKLGAIAAQKYRTFRDPSDGRSFLDKEVVMRTKILVAAVMILSLAGLLTSCGGGGGGSAIPFVPVNGGQPATNDPGTPAISGFDYSLKEGDFWEYGWKKNTTTFSISGSSNATIKSYFRITMGTPSQIAGKTAYPLLHSGTGDYVKGSWTHLALENNIFYASQDGATWKELFNAQTGLVQGNGFFKGLGGSLFQTTTGSITNDYISDPDVFVISQSTDNSQCQYYPGVGTICGDSGSTRTDREYYEPAVGPVGGYYYFSYTAGSGDTYYSSTSTENIGMVKSSFRGDVVDYILEAEPNNLIAEAMSLVPPVKVHGDDVADDNTTASVVPLNAASEAEPNSSSAAAQVITPPIRLSGNAAVGDAGTSVNLSSIGAGTQTIEDWYKITTTKAASSADPLMIDLDFATGPAADLDLYLLNQSLAVLGYSYKDNPTTGSYNESFSLSSLPAGTYYLLVDASANPKVLSGTRASYALTASFWSKQNEVTVYDWFALTLTNSRRISVNATNGWAVILMNDPNGTPIASAFPTVQGGSASMLTSYLSAGTYYIGIAWDKNIAGPYTMSASLQ